MRTLHIFGPAFVAFIAKVYDERILWTFGVLEPATHLTHLQGLQLKLFKVTLVLLVCNEVLNKALVFQ